MRKLFTFLIALVASANMMFAESGPCGENLTWDLTDGVLTIAGSGAMTDFENNTYAPWNGYSSLIQSVVIRDSVTTVGNYAFAFCSNLSTISLGDSLISIGEYAFFSCTLLGGATIPDKVITIGDYAFANCDRLSSVELGESVESIGDYVFNRCVNLSTVTLSERVKSIGKAAFMNCQKLSEVTNYVAEPQIIESDVFSAVDLSASTLYVPGNSVELYQDAVGWKEFGNIQAIKCIIASGTCGAQGDNLTWELSCDSVLTISGTGEMDSWFNDPYLIPTPWGSVGQAITSIIISDGVTNIGAGAFRGCSNLTSVAISNSVTSIEDFAFGWCSGMTSITIPNSVTSIVNGAFRGCAGLTSIVVEKGNTIYDSRDNCNAIIETASNTLVVGCKNTIIPNSVTTIGKYAFNGCSGMTSLEIPYSVTSIENQAFSNCSGLTSVTIPNSVTSIKNGAFGGCVNLTSIVVENGNTIYDSRNNCNAIIETASNTLVVGCRNTIIPNSVISIGNSAYSGCSNMTSITIPNSITSIGVYAFNGCSGLTSIDIPSSVKSIGGGAFYGCSGLTSINIPNSVTSIGVSAFSYCSGLTSIEIPNSVTSIENGTFYGCTGLTRITIPNNITSIGNQAFVECSGLTSIEIPNSVKSIGEYAFVDCVSLTSVTIPNSITSIGDYAFALCTGLTSVTCEAIIPPTCGENVFYEVDKSIPLYVPAGSVDDYRNASQWSDFGDNIQPIQAEEVPVTEIEAEPTYNSVVIEWPKVDEATVYTIEIRKDGELICTLTFNEQGQLQNIAFAKPSRNGGRNSQVRMAIQTATGWQYTISGLDPETEYTYSVVAKKNAGDTETLFSDSVTFTTKQTPTGVDEVSDQPSEVRKLLRNGQLLIIRNGEIFNAQGARVE